MNKGEMPGRGEIALFLLFATAVFVFSACTGRQNLTDSSPTLALDMVVLLSPTPSDSGMPTIEDEQDSPEVAEGCPRPYEDSLKSRPDYKLAASLITDLNNLAASQLVIYPNPRSVSLEQIFFVVEPNLMAGVFQLREVSVSGAEIDDYRLEGNQLSVPLRTPLPPGCSVQIAISFNLALPQQAGIFGYSGDQFTLSNWYPFVPPYQPGKGWLVHPPGSYGEHLVYPAADFEVVFRVEGLQEDDFLIAAPAPAEELDGGRFLYRLDGARTFALAVLSNYSSISAMIEDIPVTVYYQQGDARSAEAALETIGKALQYYSQVFGAYPFDSLTLAEIDMLDGMEFDGMFFLGKIVFETYKGTLQNNLVLLSAHETAHNWWYSQVGNDQAMEPWLDEAFCVYSELLFLEEYYPHLTKWWWQFRVNAFEPAGPVDVSIYEFYQYEPYRQAVYLQGALFIQSVRDLVGDDAFFEFLRLYLEDGRHQLVTAEEFFQILAQVTSAPVDDLKEAYFRE